MLAPPHRRLGHVRTVLCHCTAGASGDEVGTETESVEADWDAITSSELAKQVALGQVTSVV
eukprot:SAG31_NODE_43145_length_268_cov_0.857988_1_plen_61_part_00